MNVSRHEHRKRNTTADESIDKKNEKTIVLFTHGGTVSQFYVNLTGNNPKKHGHGKYRNNEEVKSPNTERNDIGNEKWIPLVENRLMWDDGKKHESSKDLSR